jgi:hypothetical protein
MDMQSGRERNSVAICIVQNELQRRRWITSGLILKRSFVATTRSVKMLLELRLVRVALNLGEIAQQSTTRVKQTTRIRSKDNEELLGLDNNSVPCR